MHIKRGDVMHYNHQSTGATLIVACTKDNKGREVFTGIIIGVSNPHNKKLPNRFAVGRKSKHFYSKSYAHVKLKF